MNLSRSLAAVSMVLIASYAVASKSPVGTWTGHIAFAMPAGTPQQQQQMAQAKAMLAKMKITLTFKGDHSYVSAQSGGPMGTKSENGNWSQSGNDITLTSSKIKGSGQHFVLSKDGHSLKLDTAKMPKGLEVTFTR
jgi:hypothetical protein